MRRLAPHLALLFAVLAASPALAAPGKMAEQARAYAAKHNLPIREVPINVPGHEGVRIFVPVTEASHNDFIQEFTGSGAVIRQQQSDAEHVSMALTPTDIIHNWGNPGPMFAPSAGGLYVALSLTAEEKAHFKSTLQEAQNTNFIGKNGSANCTRWLVHGKIGPEQPLAHKFGIKRANAPSNLIKKLIHAGNDDVVIGIAMSSQGAQQTQNLRNQLAGFDRNVQTLQAQIAAFEAQGGNRVKLFETQTAPYREAIAQLEASIATRQDKPAIVAALQGQIAKHRETIATLTQQHEAPYHQRIGQLEGADVAAKAKVEQLRGSLDANLKVAHEQLSAREHEKAELLRLAPGPGNPHARFERKLLEVDTASAQLKGQIDQLKAQKEAARGPWRAQIATATQQFDDAARQGPGNVRANGVNLNAYNQRVAQLEQTAHGFETAIQQHQAQPGFQHQVADWQRALEQAKQQKDELVRQGVDNFNPQYDQRLAQLDQQIAGVRANLNASPAHPGVPQWLGQLGELVRQREEVVRQGPADYNPQYEQRLVQLDQQIAANENNLKQYAGQPNQQVNLVSWGAEAEKLKAIKAQLVQHGGGRYDPAFDQRLTQPATLVAQARVQLAQLDAQEEQQVAAVATQLAQRQQERDGLVQRGPDAFHPEYDAEQARLDQLIAQNQNQINVYRAQPRYAANIAQWQQAIAVAAQAKAALAATPPSQYNPQYVARLAQLDQAIAQTQAALNQYGQAPQYQANLAGWRQQIEQNTSLKQELEKIGPAGYDPQFDQKLAQVAQAVAQAQAQVTAVEAQAKPQLEAAEQELSRTEGLLAELKRHGALNYNPAYEQRLAQLDQIIAQNENNIRAYPTPQHQNNRLQWAAQIEQTQKLKAELMAKGPVGYNPNEPQIQQLQVQLAQNETAAAELKRQIDLADAVSNGGAALAEKFAAIPDQTLLGAPPGAGAAEAIRQ